MNYDKNSFLAGLAVGRKLCRNGGGPEAPSTPAGSTIGTPLFFGSGVVYRYAGKVLANASVVFGEITEEG